MTDETPEAQPKVSRIPRKSRCRNGHALLRRCAASVSPGPLLPQVGGIHCMAQLRCGMLKMW